MLKRCFLTLLILAACTQIMQAQQEQNCIEQNNPKSATVCYGISITIELDSAMVWSGKIERYLWEQRIDTLAVWEDAVGENTEINYTTPKLEESTYYRRVVFGACKGVELDTVYMDTIYSAPTLITVLPEFSAGVILSKEINTNGDSLILIIKDTVSASGGDEKITYRWKMDNQVIPGDKPELEIHTDTLSIGTYLFTREARDGACAGGWVASNGYCKVTVPDTTTTPPPPPPPCKLNPNDIVAKTDINGTPYMLIYPNPDRVLQYQWYKDDKPIANANGQFYYPPNGKLQKDAQYKVEIWEKHDTTCRNFSNVYKILEKPNLPAPYFTVTPNPVSNDNFTVSFNQELLQNKNDVYLLSIYSSMGEKIWELKINDLNDITISKQMPKGICFITLTVDNEQYSKKIIIQ